VHLQLVTALARSLWLFAASSLEQCGPHLSLSLGGWMGRQSAKNVLQ